VSERFPSEPVEEITRRQWLLRLGETVALAGISGLVPESVAVQFIAGDEAQPDAAALPPGLYAPSAELLVHILHGADKNYVTPPGSETEYAPPTCAPYQPQFFSERELRIVTRFVEIVLGKMDPAAISETIRWLDLWLQSAAGVLEAAQHLDSLHRILAVAYYGDASVHELETSNPQVVARQGIAALHERSLKAHGRGFLELTESEQIVLVASLEAAQPDSPLHKFFHLLRNEAIRGYYTSVEGLKELDFKGNAYYQECPGCPANQRRRQNV
jgi:hypothetical protein